MGDFEIINGVLKRYRGKGGKVSVPDGVTVIGDGAFQLNESLTGIVLPEGVTAISKGAFQLCSALKEVSLPDSLVAIGEEAFCGCGSLGQIDLPDGVVILGKSSFQFCSAMTRITLSKRLMTLGDSTFSGCTALKSAALPESVQSVGSSLFWQCENLESVSLPGEVASFGKGVFEFCEHLTDIKLPEGVKEIDRAAFKECTGIKHISLPQSVTSISDGAFADCACLREICVSPENPAYTHIEGVLYTKDRTEAVRCPRGKAGEICLPKEIIRIPAGAFENCTLLERIRLHPGMSPEIRSGAFKNTPRIWFDLPCDFPDEGARDRSVLHCCQMLLEKELEPVYEEEWKSCMDAEKENLYDLALKKTDVLQYMAQEGLIAKDDLLDLIEQADSEGRTILLAYEDRKVSPEEREKMQDQVLEAAFTGILSPFQAREDWAYEPIGEGEIRIWGYIGKEPEAEVPNGIGKRTVTEIGPFAFSPEATLFPKPVLDLRRQITAVYLPEHLRTVGNNAFEGCEALASILVPEEVEKVGSRAFEGCINLAEIQVSPGNRCYADPDGILCTKDEKTVIRCPQKKEGTAVLPGDAEEICREAFSSCEKLTEIILPENLKLIDEEAFRGCSGIKNLTLPERITAVSRYAFSGCTSLEKIILPAGVTEIGDYGFWGCTELASVTLSESLTAIGERAFFDCTAMTELHLPETVEEIGDNAFWGCRCLTDITLPESLTYIGRDAFGCCPELTIHAPVGSYGEVYAKRNGIPFDAK